MARLPLKSRPLWQISVTTSREAADAVAALLERLFGQLASTYIPEDKDIAVTTVYSSENAAWVRSKRKLIQSGLYGLHAFDLSTGPTTVLIRRVPREDWATSWKKYFKTIRVGRALLIKPSWSKEKGLKNQAIVTLDPGLSFGTGQHPTTSFCLYELVRSREPGESQAFLDLGCGSGILAISAAKLGYSPVRAIDNDPTAVRVAQTNARKNRVSGRLTIARQDLTRLPKNSTVQYDLVCANLVWDLLLSERERVVNRLRSGGKLVLAGLLTDQFDGVAKAYLAAGLKQQKVVTEGEWTSGTFSLPQ